MPDILIDLHTHTNASDGALAPRELICFAHKSGFKAIAITDHDTVDGLPEAVQTGFETGIQVIPGVELSVNHELGSLHLLAYGINYRNKTLLGVLESLKNSRTERNLKILSRLESLGYHVSLEDVERIAGNGTIGRGHIGLALIEAGYFLTIQETFDNLLTRGGPAYIDRFRLGMKDGVDIIHAAGGVSVWAHPGLHEEELEGMFSLLPGWVAAGLDGIESDYSQHSLQLRDRLRVYAREFGIIYTGGSDFHGAVKPGISLGDGPEGERIDPACLNALNARMSSLVA